MSFDWQKGNDVTNARPSTMNVSEEQTDTLASTRVPAVVTIGGDVAHALTHDGHDASEDGTGRGTPIVVGSLSAADGKSQFFGAQAVAAGHVVPSAGIPRRLTPRECERLMGWPDDWTLVQDERGRWASDAARYKMCGNGVVSHVAEWIASRLIALESAA